MANWSSDDEIASMVERVVSGVSVDDELMGVDLIKGVGIGGNFLTQWHSLKHLASDKLKQRSLIGAWEEHGRRRELGV